MTHAPIAPAERQRAEQLIAVALDIADMPRDALRRQPRVRPTERTSIVRDAICLLLEQHTSLAWRAIGSILGIAANNAMHGASRASERIANSHTETATIVTATAAAWEIRVGETVTLEARALTVKQPYASMIASGAKRIENRTRTFAHRGLLAIHAGSSQSLMPPSMRGTLPLGAVVAFVRVVACLHLADVRAGNVDPAYAWVADDEHACGPCCLVFDRIAQLPQPIPCAGHLGLWRWPVPPHLRELAEDVRDGADDDGAD